MSQASKRKVELIVPGEEVGDFLIKIGQELVNGELVIGQTQIDMRNYKSLGLSIKDDGDAKRIKLKVKYPDAEEEPAAEGAEEDAGEAEPRDVWEGEEELLLADPEEEYSSLSTRPLPKYGHLKKRMKGQFKAIRRALESGTLPDRHLVNVFAKDSELMVAYPGKGDTYYSAYESALQRFLVAVSARDAEQVRAGFEALDHVMHSCHDEYK